MRTLRGQGANVVGLDLVESPFTDLLGSVADRDFVERSVVGVHAVLHTATLHKPHVATHSRQAFVDTNITGTLNLLEAAVTNQVQAFIFTSTTSVFGDALTPRADAPAVWVDESLTPISKNIYGATKLAAEDLCQLFQRNQQLPCLVLRTSRFFPEADDDPKVRAKYSEGNIKVNELVNRRADIQDLVDAHLLAIERAPELGFGRFVLSATTPFSRDEVGELRCDAAAVLARHVPEYVAEYARRGWHVSSDLGRVYSNALALKTLGWRPKYDFAHAIARLRTGEDPRSPLAQAIGVKGYHGAEYRDGIFPVE